MLRDRRQPTARRLPSRHPTPDRLLESRRTGSWAVIDDFGCGSRSQHLRPRWPHERPSGAEMAKLIYAAIASLDGYVEDEEGRSDWAMPAEELHAFVNDLERQIGTYVYG